MDDAILETIRKLAEEHGLDPETLMAAFASGDMPEELEQAMNAVLVDLGTFSQALGKLGK